MIKWHQQNYEGVGLGLHDMQPIETGLGYP